MATIQATDRLVIELHPSQGSGDEGRLVIKALEARGQRRGQLWEKGRPL